MDSSGAEGALCPAVLTESPPWSWEPSVEPLREGELALWGSSRTACLTLTLAHQVGDGHPLRLWKVSTDVEAPPAMVLHRVLRERHLWDEDLLQSKVVEALDKNMEVYHYITDSMAPHPRRDCVVLR